MGGRTAADRTMISGHALVGLRLNVDASRADGSRQLGFGTEVSGARGQVHRGSSMTMPV